MAATPPENRATAPWRSDAGVGRRRVARRATVRRRPPRPPRARAHRPRPACGPRRAPCGASRRRRAPRRPRRGARGPRARPRARSGRRSAWPCARATRARSRRSASCRARARPRRRPRRLRAGSMTALPLPLPCPSITWSMRRNSDSSPKTSVPLPGSIETRASGATSQRSDARSIRPRRPRSCRVRVQVRQHAHRVVERGQRRVDAARRRPRPRPCGGGACVSADTPLRSRSAAPWASCVSSQPSSCRVSLPFDTRRRGCQKRVMRGHAPIGDRAVLSGRARRPRRAPAPCVLQAQAPLSPTRAPRPRASHVSGTFARPTATVVAARSGHCDGAGSAIVRCP